MKTKEEVLSLLEKLGKTKEDVANKLQSLGIKGERNKCYSCPLAQYLIKNGIGLKVPFVVEVRVGVGVNWYWYPISKYPQLQGIRDFILAFDRGEFPQLESET